MSWLLSIVVSLFSGLLGLLVGGLVASLAIDWYRISSFEGGSGYFAVAMALLGFIIGAIIGLVTSRMLADASFVRALGMSAGVIVASGLAIAGVSRLAADVPPTLDGEPVFLAFEVRWPTAESRAPADFPGIAGARLGATSGQQVRQWGDGVLFVEDAHQVEGRWVVPGVANIFTARGRFLLEARIGDSTLIGILLPFRGAPGAEEREWSEWIPRARPGDPPLPDGYRVRYRVVNSNEPARVQQVGNFTILTRIFAFIKTANTDEQEATSQLSLQYHDRPIPGLDTLGAVALLGGEPVTFLVGTGEGEEGDNCQLVSEQDGAPLVRPAGRCTVPITGELLTADSAAWLAWRRHPAPRGWLDRRSFATPGLYRLPGGILDTRTRSFTGSPLPVEPSPINGLPPISLAPDEASYAWFTQDGEGEAPVLAVTNWREQTTYTVPIDRPRMRYNEYDRLDPGWVAHHFEWRKATDGWRLVARDHFTPLPYRGDREIDSKGEMSSYYLKPGGTALRDAMVDAMVHELGAVREPDDLGGYHKVVRYEGKLIKTAYVDGGGFVSIGMDYGSVDSPLMQRLADRLDALLATGRYDAYFHGDQQDPPPS